MTEALALKTSWMAAWDLADQIFDRSGHVSDVIAKLETLADERRDEYLRAGGDVPTRADLTEVAALLCQLIKQSVAVAETLLDQLPSIPLDS
jgi:hypothetical protein